MSIGILATFEAFSLALFYSCFCRLAFTSKSNTKRAIRWVFTMLGIVAAMCAAAPLLWAYEPDGLITALMGITALAQIVTSHHWRHGVPAQFTKDSP